jgi:Cu/Ag efflux pump CusA
MRIWIDPDRLASFNLSPGDVQGALRRNNYLAAVGRTKGNLVQVNLLANTDLRSAEEFEDLIVADRGGAIVRLKDIAKVEREAEEADMVAKYNSTEGVYSRLVSSLVRTKSTLNGCVEREMSASGRQCRRRRYVPSGVGRCSWNALTETTKT